MLTRFPIESKGRRKKLNEVGFVTGICCTCFLIRCIVPWISRAYDPRTRHYSKMYYNHPEVQKALHANVTGIKYQWNTCRYQAQLQKNLLYLAAIADAQPQSPAMRPQMIPHAAMPQAGGAQYMQQPGPILPPKTPLQFTPQQVQELQQQQQLHHQPHMMPFPGHMSMRPVGVFNGSSEAQSEVQRGTTPSSSVDGRGGKEDAGGAVSKNVDDGRKKLVAEPASGDADPSGNPKRTEETKTP